MFWLEAWKKEKSKQAKQMGRKGFENKISRQKARQAEKTQKAGIGKADIWAGPHLPLPGGSEELSRRNMVAGGGVVVVAGRKTGISTASASIRRQSISAKAQKASSGAGMT